MRAELEQVELIERYLLGDLSAEEKAGFESEMNADSSLSAKVTAQRSVMGAIQRIGVKSAAASAYVGWKLRKWLKRIALLLILGGGIGMSVFLLSRRECVSCETEDQISFFQSIMDGQKCCEEDCVPCEPKETQSGDGYDEVMEKNCCEYPVLESVSSEDHHSHVGFEIKVENKGENHMSSEGHESEDLEVVNNDNNNSTTNNSSDNSDVQLLSSEDPSEAIEFEIMDQVDTLNKDDGKLTQIFYPRDEDQNPEETAYWESLDVQPSFPGGNGALNKFLADNLQYPTEAQYMGLQGTVYVSFVIAKNGKIKKAYVSKGVHELIDEEALRVIKLMPNWNPGKQGDKAVNVSYTIPVRFVLSGFESNQ